MTNSYIFKNPGLIDKRFITTMGVSVKEGDNPIGFFGTGLKYAISVLLRNNCKITIYSGLEKFEFSLKKETIRNQTFNIVCMNNRKLSFTTDYGKNWQLWQAIRELYSNCLDEKGTLTESSQPLLFPEKGFTCIIVEGGVTFSTDSLIDVMADLGKIFISPTRKPLFSTPELDVYNGKSSDIYYRGVRANTISRDSQFTYNIKRKVELTEDRTVKYNFVLEEIICRNLALCEDRNLLKHILTAPKDFYEHYMQFDIGINLSETFSDTVFALKKVNTIPLNVSAVMATLKKNTKLQELLEPEEIELNSLEKERLRKSINFLKKLDIDVTNYPIKIVESLGKDILGQAKEGKIYISRLSLDMGTKILAGTLAEEYFHLEHNLIDCTYEMQNFLFNKLMTLGELYIGETL